MNTHFSSYGFARPQTSVFIMPVDTAPIKIEPEPPRQFQARMLAQYREKGYALGKSRRGFKKWVTKRLLKALGCKTYNQAMRKHKK